MPELTNEIPDREWFELKRALIELTASGTGNDEYKARFPYILKRRVKWEREVSEQGYYIDKKWYVYRVTYSYVLRDGKRTYKEWPEFITKWQYVGSNSRVYYETPTGKAVYYWVKAGKRNYHHYYALWDSEGTVK